MFTAIDSSMLATDLAYYLGHKGMPFREAHAVAGKAVRAAEEKNVQLGEMPLEAYQVLCPAFEADVVQVFDALKSVEKRNAIGGTSPQSVKNQIQIAKSALSPNGKGRKSQGVRIMSTVTCSECAAEITLAENTEVGEIIVCPDCGVDLEVTALEPAAIQLAPMEQEDWGE